MDHQFVAADSEETLAANASAWSVSVGVSTASQRRYASYRAYQIDRVYEIDDTTKIRRVSRNAIYYAWRVYVGRRYEVLLEGDAQAFHAGARAELGVFSGAIDDFSRRHHIESKVVADGLKPKSTTAIFAKGPEEIERAYEQNQEAVPILVEWRLIPGREGRERKIEWVGRRKGCVGQPGCEPCQQWSFSVVEYTPPARKRGGHAWDADGSPPDVMLDLGLVGGDAGRRSHKFQDARAARWEVSPAFSVQAGKEVRLRATDVDLLDHDPIDVVTVAIPSELETGTIEFPGGATRMIGVCSVPSVR